MSSDQHNSTMAKAMCLIFSLFDVASAREVPFDILQYMQYILYGLTSVLLCVPFTAKVSIRWLHVPLCNGKISSYWLLWLHSCFSNTSRSVLVVMSWTQLATKCNGYFAFQTIIDTSVKIIFKNVKNRNRDWWKKQRNKGEI